MCETKLNFFESNDPTVISSLLNISINPDNLSETHLSSTEKIKDKYCWVNGKKDSQDRVKAHGGFVKLINHNHIKAYILPKIKQLSFKKSENRDYLNKLDNINIDDIVIVGEGNKILFNIGGEEAEKNLLAFEMCEEVEYQDNLLIKPVMDQNKAKANDEEHESGEDEEESGDESEEENESDDEDSDDDILDYEDNPEAESKDESGSDNKVEEPKAEKPNQSINTAETEVVNAINEGLEELTPPLKSVKSETASPPTNTFEAPPLPVAEAPGAEAPVAEAPGAEAPNNMTPTLGQPPPPTNNLSAPGAPPAVGNNLMAAPVAEAPGAEAPNSITPTLGQPPPPTNNLSSLPNPFGTPEAQPASNPLAPAPGAPTNNTFGTPEAPPAPGPPPAQPNSFGAAPGAPPVNNPMTASVTESPNPFGGAPAEGAPPPAQPNPFGGAPAEGAGGLPGQMGGGYTKVTKQIKNLEKLLRKLNKSVLKTKKKKSISNKYSKRNRYFV